jgi:hypothetical protein
MMKYPEGPNDARTKFPGLEWKYTRVQVSQLTAFDAKTTTTSSPKSAANCKSSTNLQRPLALFLCRGKGKVYGDNYKWALPN